MLFFSLGRFCRSGFTLCGALIAQLIFVSTVHAADAVPAASDCKVAVQLYSFRNDLDRDLSGTLARIKQLGINCVEGYSLHGRSADQLRKEFDHAGLRVISFHLPEELR